MAPEPPEAVMPSVEVATHVEFVPFVCKTYPFAALVPTCPDVNTDTAKAVPHEARRMAVNVASMAINLFISNVNSRPLKFLKPTKIRWLSLFQKASSP